MLSKLEQKLEVIEDMKRDISVVMNLIPQMKWKFSMGSIHIDTSYYDDAHNGFLDEYAPLAEKLAFEIKDYDCPTSLDEARIFCEFMNFDEKDTNTILDACYTMAQYIQWQKEENDMRYL